MLEQLKKIADVAKAILLWIVAPLLALGGLVIYLLQSKKEAEDKAAGAETKIATIEAKKEASDADQKANSSVDAYKRLRDAYLGKK